MFAVRGGLETFMLVCFINLPLVADELRPLDCRSFSHLETSRDHSNRSVLNRLSHPPGS